MADIAKRFDSNPIIKPSQVKPSIDGLEVECVLNPGAFRFKNKIGLLMRVAERPKQIEGKISTPVLDPLSETGMRIIQFDLNDPDLQLTDTRGFKYKGQQFLTTMSHLRLAWSNDGISFRCEEKPSIIGADELESFGIEDCRVAFLDDVYYLNYTAVSPDGFGIGMITTSDWESYNRHGMILAPSNKDFALFESKFGSYYVAMHRPSPMFIGANNIWISRSPDMIHWGYHKCIARVREGMWDSERIGAGASPIKTDYGWLEIYHGADQKGRYCLGAMLLDSADPSIILARSDDPIMEPIMEYEQKGFFGNCIFTNGHVVNGDEVIVYYGASDTVICGANMKIGDIMDSLR